MLRHCTIMLCAMVWSIGYTSGHAEAATAAVSTDSFGSIVSPVIDSEQEGGGRVQERLQVGNPLWAIPLSTLAITRERPLFSPSRRPAPPPPVAPAVYVPSPTSSPAEPDHPLLTLLGTIVGETDRIGIFMDQASQSVVRLKTGENNAGWVLLSVEGREVTFAKGSRTATLTLPARGAEQGARADRDQRASPPSADKASRPMTFAPPPPAAQPANRSPRGS
jgi:hypothetical protein